MTLLMPTACASLISPSQSLAVNIIIRVRGALPAISRATSNPFMPGITGTVLGQTWHLIIEEEATHNCRRSETKSPIQRAAFSLLESVAEGENTWRICHT
jgi:hypothetical protein